MSCSIPGPGIPSASPRSLLKKPGQTCGNFSRKFPILRTTTLFCPRRNRRSSRSSIPPCALSTWTGAHTMLFIWVRPTGGPPSLRRYPLSSMSSCPPTKRSFPSAPTAEVARDSLPAMCGHTVAVVIFCPFCPSRRTAANGRRRRSSKGSNISSHETENDFEAHNGPCHDGFPVCENGLFCHRAGGL